MKYVLLLIVLTFVIMWSVMAQSTTSPDLKTPCKKSTETTAPWEDSNANCKYPGKIHIGPSGGSPYRYDEKGSPKGLFPSGSGYITCNLNYYVCGDHFFKGKVINVNAGEKCPEWNVEYSEVCCDKWEEAKRTKSPCDVTLDSDCDGTPNGEDDRPVEPDGAKGSGEFKVTAESLRAAFVKAFDTRGVKTSGDFVQINETEAEGGKKFLIRLGREYNLLPSPDWLASEIAKGNIKEGSQEGSKYTVLGMMQSSASLCKIRINTRIVVTETGVVNPRTGKGDADLSQEGLEQAVNEALGELGIEFKPFTPLRR